MGWLPLLALMAVLDPEVSEPSGDEDTTEPRQTVVVGAEAALYSTYIFRGERQYGSGTVPSLQPSLWVELPGLGPGALRFDLWSAIAVADWDRVDDDAAASEVDLGVVYRASLLSDWLQLGVGFTYYIYPEHDPVDGEKEILVELGLGNLPIEPSVALWTEVHPGLGIHIEPRVAWEQAIGNLAVGADLSMGASIYRGDEATLDHATLALLVAQSVGDLTVGLSISYAIQLAPGRGSFLERSLLYGGVAVSWEGER